MESLVKEVEEGIRGTRITVEGEDEEEEEVEAETASKRVEALVAAGEKS